MAAPDNWIVLLAVGIGGPLVASALTYLGTRTSAKPSAEQARTAHFDALVGRLEKEVDRRVADNVKLESELLKLEAVAADLEVMVIRLLAWADEVSVEAERRGLDLPVRPKFRHMADGKRTPASPL